ncbi:MAG: tol-pal system protein YbgF [Pseudomonadota bacterium]
MIRISILVASLLTLTATLFSADAQRVRREEFDTKMQALQQADTDGRIATAEVGARITDLNAKNAELNGKVETLEFLLSQSRDQVNQMQADDTEIAQLIQRLERRLAAQDTKIRELESKLTSVQATIIGVPLDGTVEAAGNTEVVVTGGAGAQTSTTRIVDAQTEGRTIRSTSTVTSQPTRITRTLRETPIGTDTSDALQQGTLGQISASNLPGEAGPLFAEAKSRLLRFDYEGAEGAFRLFIDEFGDDPQAGEAQYWLAESLYQQEAYAESGQAYTDMIRTYPDDPRAPEALAKLARAMRLVGDTERACNALNLLPQQYPNASGLTQNLARGERVRSGCDS